MASCLGLELPKLRVAKTPASMPVKMMTRSKTAIMISTCRFQNGRDCRCGRFASAYAGAGAIGLGSSGCTGIIPWADIEGFFCGCSLAGYEGDFSDICGSGGGGGGP